MMGLLPRARYLVQSLSVEEQKPLLFNPLMIDSLPAELKSLTGNIRSVQQMKQNAPNLVLSIDAERGCFVLKIAKGDYRSQELWAEHTVMQLLHNNTIPLPESLAYIRCDNLSYQLRNYSHGEPISTVLRADNEARPDVIQQMGRLLASIHAVDPAQIWTWKDWINGSLKLATNNLAAGVCDPNEFTPDKSQRKALDWLIANRPSGDCPICLLHGDYRPKNILWENGQIVGVIDWQFVDVGDPYYDLSIIHWYMQSEAEWQIFLNAYDIHELDQERFAYCMVLQKFLNV